MWESPLSLYQAIVQTAMESTGERSPSLKTRLSSVAIFILVANHEVRLSRARAFTPALLQLGKDADKKNLRGTTRVLDRSGDGPESQL